ncbi:hypothetical protein QBE53_14755 [Vallitaleaceae bacterium 9-2]
MENFTIVKRGYDPEQVDHHIFLLNEELKQHKANAEAVTNAMVHAEMTARKIVEDAEKKADTIEGDAHQHLAALERKIKHIRMKLDAFQSQYNQLIHRYVISMNNDDFSNLYASLDKITKSLHTKRSDTDHSVIEMNYEQSANDY